MSAFCKWEPMLQTWLTTKLQLKCKSVVVKGDTWKMKLLLPKAEHPKQAKPAAQRVWGKTQISHSESSHWLPVRLQVTCRWSHLISRSRDKAKISLFSASWYLSVYFFSLLQFLNFMLWIQFGIFLKLSPALNIVTVNKDLISSIIYMFPSFCPLYSHLKEC